MNRCPHADPLAGIYQPLNASRDIRRCPLPIATLFNRHTPVTERSVALLAPHSPKCPGSADGSARPARVRKYCRQVVLYAIFPKSQAPTCRATRGGQCRLDLLAAPTSISARATSSDGSTSSPYLAISGQPGAGPDRRSSSRSGYIRGTSPVSGAHMFSSVHESWPP